MRNEDLAESVTLAAGYLARHVQQSGKFVYRKHTQGKSVKKDYNVLRHAGSVYALAVSRPYWDGDLQTDVDRALHYLLWRFLVKTKSENGPSRVIVDGREGKAGSNTVKLGGLALSIIAMIAPRASILVLQDDACRCLSTAPAEVASSTYVNSLK